MTCLLLLTLGRLHSSSDSALALSLPVTLLATSVLRLKLIGLNSHTNVQINLWDVSVIVVRIFHFKKPQTNRVEFGQSIASMSNWKSAVAPLTSRTRSHVSRSSECLRKHFGFLILNAIFSQVKCQIKKIFSGFLIDIEIYRISNFQRKKDYLSLTFNPRRHKGGGGSI